jgi:hypothetical protein
VVYLGFSLYFLKVFLTYPFRFYVVTGVFEVLRFLKEHNTSEKSLSKDKSTTIRWSA